MRLLFPFLFDKPPLFRYGVFIVTVRRCFVLKGRRLLPLVLLLLFILPVSALAHPGGTDANGGHYDGSEYHYHHGYPAHQHTNGVCPYDSSVSGGSSGQTASAKSSNASDSYDLLIVLICLVCALPSVLIVMSIVFRRKRFSPYIFFFSALAWAPVAWGTVCGLYDIDAPEFVNGAVIVACYVLMFMLFRCIWDSSSSTYGKIFRLYRIVDYSGSYCRHTSPGVSSYGCIEVEFTKDASYSNNAFRKALFDIAAHYPEHTEKIIFHNLCSINGGLIDAAAPLFFDYMDFSEVRLKDCPTLKFWFENLDIPAKNFALPADIGSIHLPEGMADVRSICIPSDAVIPCYSMKGTVYVNSDLKFFVPEELIPYYRSSERWAVPLFIDESGNTYTPVFLPYYK